MSLVAGWATNVGSVRKENQDSCFVRINENEISSVAVAVICDGMGGLSDGAIASKSVCDAVKVWFERELNVKSQRKELSYSEIFLSLDMVMKNVNEELVHYGNKKKVKVGTTASVLVLLNNQYYIAHVGDSRIYNFKDCLKQLTEDDSIAAYKMQRGEITYEEYKKSNQKHILTQCVGVNSLLNIHHYNGTYDVGDMFFLCCDGMYHCLEGREIENMLRNQQRMRGSGINMTIEKTIDKVISRGESDNITGVIICAV